MAATATTRRTRRKPAAANGATTEAVEAMLAGLGPLDPERSVHAALARKLAATLDAMAPPVAAKMSGQTAGALLRTLDKLGAPRGDGIVSTSGRRPQLGASNGDTTTTTPAPEAEAPTGEEVWHLGIEDCLYAEKLSGIIHRHARRRGLPLPGSPAYGRAPWAVSPWDWVAEQKAKRQRSRSGRWPSWSTATRPTTWCRCAASVRYPNDAVSWVLR